MAIFENAPSPEITESVTMKTERRNGDETEERKEMRATKPERRDQAETEGKLKGEMLQR
jgi:hypothetical protein